MSLDRLVGTWRFTMQHVAVPEPVLGEQRYQRVLDGAFLRLDWHYARPDFPDALVLLDETSYHYFDVRGVIRVFDLHVDDEGLSLSRRHTDHGQRSALRFVGVDAMEGTGELSHDGGATWQHDFTLACTRVA